MAIKAGSRVKFLGSASDDPCELVAGQVYSVLTVWEGSEYPYEISGSFERVAGSEIVAV